MVHSLHLHPDSICEAVTGIDVDFERQADRLAVRFEVRGNLADMEIPAVAVPRRRRELWQHFCCEVFLAASNDSIYYEFNFSPSTEWAAYRFDDYRIGMKPADEVGAPKIEVRRDSPVLELRSAVTLPNRIAMQSTMRIGLATVIEERIGRKSYWALAHPSGKPDFHHSCNFIEVVPS